MIDLYTSATPNGWIVVPEPLVMTPDDEEKLKKMAASILVAKE